MPAKGGIETACEMKGGENTSGTLEKQNLGRKIVAELQPGSYFDF